MLLRMFRIPLSSPKSLYIPLNYYLLVIKMRNIRCYRIEGEGIKSTDGNSDKSLEEALNKPYEWLRKKFKGNEEVLDNLQGYRIIFKDLGPFGGRVDYKKKIIWMHEPSRTRASAATNASSPSSIEDRMSHELTHVLRGRTPYKTREEVAIEEGAATFVQMLYAIERGGEVAENFLSYLTKLKPYSRNSWNGFHYETFEKEFNNPEQRELSPYLKQVIAHLYCGGLCIYLELANKYGVDRVLSDVPCLVTPEDFEEKYGKPYYPNMPNCLFEAEEFSKYLHILQERAKFNSDTL